MPVRRTGWKPVPPKAAGTEARPTPDFVTYIRDTTLLVRLPVRVPVTGGRGAAFVEVTL